MFSWGYRNGFSLLVNLFSLLSGSTVIDYSNYCTVLWRSVKYPENGLDFNISNCFLNAGVPDADGEAHGEEELPREAPRGGRDARLDVYHLLRQDRHADAEPHDRRAPLVRRSRVCRRHRRASHRNGYFDYYLELIICTLEEYCKTILRTQLMWCEHRRASMNTFVKLVTNTCNNCNSWRLLLESRVRRWLDGSLASRKPVQPMRLQGWRGFEAHTQEVSFMKIHWLCKHANRNLGFKYIFGL